MDGSGLGGLDDETFSADEAIVTVTGVDVHPGQATGKLVSALRVASEIVAELPSDRLTPDTTSGREGFIHPYELTGSAARAEIRLIVRDFDEELLHEHTDLLRDTAERVVAAHPGATLEFDVRRQYRNMRTYLAAVPEVIAAAERAIRQEGIEPVRIPIRGGTDGSRLSEMGLPTPNIFTGGHEYHSVREWASLQEMAAAAATIVHLAGVWAITMSDFGPNSLASLDGEIMLASEAVIPVTDEGLIRGDGAFEVIRVYDGVPYALDAHFARLQRTGSNIRLPIDLEAVRADSHRLLAQAGTGEDAQLLRIMITRGGRRILLTEQMPQLPDEARLMSVTYSPTRLLDGAKTLSYAANMLAGRLARESGYDEALLVTPHGRVLEAPTSSIFYVVDGELFTPPAGRAHPRLDHARARDRSDGGGRTRLHAGAAQGGRRGVPGLDRP